MKWIISVIFIQYGSYIIYSLGWSLICYLIKKKNSHGSISKIPDWKVEMVFQDLLLMSSKDASPTKDDVIVESDRKSL